jgi:O-glycosyl hydrolase
MKRKGLIAIVTAVMLATGGCSSSVPREVFDPATMTRIEIKTDQTFQTMEGFGASGCWWAQDVGGWKELDSVLDYLFDREKGIGLTIYRYNIGAGPEHKVEDPWRRTETFETAPGKYDWNRDANAVKSMKGAVERGVDAVILFANSPPGRMTKNGYTSGDFDGMPNFKEGMEEEFARYLLDIAEHFKDDGIPVQYVSPINEPQWEWKGGQEGCRFTTDQLMNVSRALVRELKKRGADIKPSFIDSGKWYDPEYTLKLYDKMVADPEIGPAMDHFAAHSYWTNDSDRRIVAGVFKQKTQKLPLHMTEWCQMESGRDLGMDAALVLAKTVHEDLTILSAASWQHWLAVSRYDYKDGLVYVDLDTKKVYDSKRMWALGNWSRYVLPGYKRIAVNCEKESLDVTGFISPDGRKTMIIAVNSGAATDIWIDNLKYKKASKHETSETHSLAEVYKGVAKKQWSLPAESITTFVYE